jgi:quercetin dioxygenase-like cupin family protein
MSLVSRLTEARTLETPAAKMQTLVSPTTGPDLPFAVWWTELPEGIPGPRHSLDVDQLVVVADGSVEIEVDDVTFTLDAGDALKLHAGAARVIRAAAGAARTLTVGHADARARVGEGEPVAVPWTA